MSTLNAQDLPDTLEIEEQKIPLVIRRNHRAKRIYLRYNPTIHSFSLTLPRRTQVSEGITFIHTKSEWIAQTLLETPNKKQLKPGVVIPILGQRCRIRRVDDLSGIFVLHDNELHVKGSTEHISRRIQDSLKKIARHEIAELAQYKASLIAKRINRITLRDTTSRWGSCSSESNLMFSWRLVYAPYEVMDYVVSHEVAHLRYMNHSSAFWDTVETLCPDYEEWKDWLRYHGKELFRYTL